MIASRLGLHVSWVRFQDFYCMLDCHSLVLCSRQSGRHLLGEERSFWTCARRGHTTFARASPHFTLTACDCRASTWLPASRNPGSQGVLPVLARVELPLSAAWKISRASPRAIESLCLMTTEAVNQSSAR